jgi:hypothetical protein
MGTLGSSADQNPTVGADASVSFADRASQRGRVAASEGRWSRRVSRKSLRAPCVLQRESSLIRDGRCPPPALSP